MMNIDITTGNSVDQVETEVRKKLIEIGYYGAAVSVGKNFLYPGAPASTLWIQSGENRNHQTILMVDGEKFMKSCKKAHRECRKKALFALIAMNQGDKRSFVEIMNELRSLYEPDILADDDRVKEITKQGKKALKLRERETDKEAIERLSKERDKLEEQLEIEKDIKWVDKNVADGYRDIPGVCREVPNNRVAESGASTDPKDYVNDDRAS